MPREHPPAAPPSVRPRRVVTDRRGGRSVSPYDSFNLGDHVGDDPAAVAANRARVARELGVPEDRLVWMNQVHGTGVAVVDGPQDGPVPGTDALVTATRGLVLAVLVADCVPILLADHVAGVVAAVHAGREGVRQGVLPAALSAMASLGARARHVTRAARARGVRRLLRGARRRCRPRWPASRRRPPSRTRTGHGRAGPAGRAGGAATARRRPRGRARPAVHRRGPAALLPPPRRRHRPPGRPRLAGLTARPVGR